MRLHERDNIVCQRGHVIGIVKKDYNHELAPGGQIIDFTDNCQLPPKGTVLTPTAYKCKECGSLWAKQKTIRTAVLGLAFDDKEVRTLTYLTKRGWV